MNSFKKFNEEKLPARKYFFSSRKKGKIDNDDKIILKILNCHYF